MKNYPLAVLGLTFAACALPASAQTADPSDWTLVWADEFDTDGAPDPTKWEAVTWGPYRVNQEQQAYLPRPENVRVEDHRLVITARKVDEEYFKYTSARLTTEGKFSFLYGRVEFRAKLPRGRGTWPALWMMPADIKGYGKGWPESGEIDVMEHVGYDPGVINSTVHTGAYNWPMKTQRGDAKPIADVFDTWHTYAVEWTPGGLVFFTDDTEIYRFANEGTGWKAWPFDKPFHLIMNIAVGGNWGGQKGIDDAIFPATMEVDWVRVYQKAKN